MVMMKANSIDGGANDSDLVYDDDLDEWVPKNINKIKEDEVITNNSGVIKLFETRDPKFLVNTKITFAKTDKSGNPTEELASFSHQNVIMSIIGAIINLIKKYQKTISPDFLSTEATIIAIDRSLSKIANVREKEKKQQPERLHISNLDDEEELVDEMMEVDKEGYFIDPYISSDIMFVPTDKKCEYDPLNASSKINKHMFLPSYKILREDEQVVQDVADTNEILQYADMDFLI
jgi:hypothetical protein